MNRLNDILKLKSAEAGGLASGPRSYNSGVVDEIQTDSERGGQLHSSSVEAKKRMESSAAAEQSSEAAGQRLSSAQFAGAIERDIDALLLQLDSLGLRLFVDDSGRKGHQYPAGEFGRIDLLATDSTGNFVVIDFKGEEPEAPCATIGQMAGYMAFVKKNLAKAGGRSVVGWILSRPSFSTDDGVLEEAADAVGIQVKWYWVRLEFLEGRGA